MFTTTLSDGDISEIKVFYYAISNFQPIYVKENVKNYCMGRKRNYQVGSSSTARQNLALVLGLKGL
jgi:hypothetical protein